MKKIFNYLYILIIVSIVNILNCNAECSYQERKDLLNDAKSVDIGFDILTERVEEVGINPDTGEEMISTMNEYVFKFYVTNLTDDIYIRYYNDYDNKEHYITKKDFTNGIYYFEDKDYMNLYTYNFEFKSNNNNCLGYQINTKKIVKPIYNPYDLFAICGYEGMQDYKYCQKFITKSFTIDESKFMSEATKYYNSLSVDNSGDENGILDLLKHYWFYGLIAISFGIICLFIYVFKKKRSEL